MKEDTKDIKMIKVDKDVWMELRWRKFSGGFKNYSEVLRGCMGEFSGVQIGRLPTKGVGKILPSIALKVEPESPLVEQTEEELIEATKAKAKALGKPYIKDPSEFSESGA